MLRRGKGLINIKTLLLGRELCHRMPIYLIVSGSTEITGQRVFNDVKVGRIIEVARGAQLWIATIKPCAAVTLAHYQR